jgi:osmotically-inducible protein OsmY
VRKLGQKWQAEADVKRVKTVVAVANDIEVRLPVLSQRPDPEIARDIVAAQRNALPYLLLPYLFEQIKAVVKDGWVALEGELEWNYQRERAEAAARHVRGGRRVSNAIKLKPSVPVPSEVKQKIEEAFRRSAEVDADRIAIETDGDRVVLRGKVRSWAESQEAERAA